jgi:TonB family protein
VKFFANKSSSALYSFFSSKIGFNFIRLVAAILISFTFFVLISMLHIMMGLGGKNDQKANAKKPVLLEVIRKAPEPEKKQSQQVKSVQNSNKSDKAFGNQSAMRFIPDLGLDNAGGGGDVVVQTRDLQAEIFEENATDEKPIPIRQDPIQYPERARELLIQGKFIALFVVGYDGRIRSIEIQQSPSPIITQEARKTISSWRFKPGKNKGVPVNVRMRQEIDFQLK